MNDPAGKVGFLSRYGLFLVLPAVMLFIVEAFFFKLFQIRNITGEIYIGKALVAFSPDLSMGLFLALCFGILVSAKLRVLSYGSLVIFGLLMSAFLILNAASHGYFMSTGSHLSAAAISYWFENATATNKIIAADAMTWRMPLLIAQPIGVFVFITTVLLPPVRRRLKSSGVFSFRRSMTYGIGLFIVAAASSLFPPLSGSTRAVSRCLPLSIGGEWIAGAGGEDEGAEDENAAAVKVDLSEMTEMQFELEEGAPRPNIVFIIFESLSWKASDVYFPDKGTTPFLAKLAKDSLVIDRDYTVVPHTSKALIPLLCGIPPYLRTKGKESTPGILPRKCLGHVLQSQGYETAFFQPAEDFEERSQMVRNMGFETFRGLDDMSHKGFEEISYFGREDMMMLKPSLEWVGAERDGPFFATFLTLSSHHNYVTPQSFQKIDYPTEDPDQNNYFNAVRYVDSFIEALITEMENEGLAENTVFIIVGDHGEAFAEHGRRQHDLIMWEEGLRSTALLYSPKYFPDPGRIDGVRSHLDFLPTVCDILGLTPKGETTEGSSLLEPPVQNRKLLHSCWFNRQCMALREGDIKTIYHYDLQGMEVFDNSKDQFDEHDLAGKGAYGEEFLEARKKEMLSWKKKVDSKYRAWGQKLVEGAIHETVPELSNKISASFGDYLEIVGFEMSPAEPEAGQSVTLRYAFKCKKKMSASSAMFVHILRKGHGGFINADHVPAKGTMPPRKWRPGSYVLDEHTVHIPTAWAGNTAQVALGFWDEGTGKRFEVTGKNLKINDRRLFVKTFNVSGETVRSTMSEQDLRDKISPWVGLEKPEFDSAVGIVFGDAVELVGVSRKRMKVKQAGTVEMDYVFKAMKDLPSSWSLTVELVPEKGDSVDGNHTPIGGLYPLGKWLPGEYVVDKHMIHIDMYDVKPGIYKAWLGFKDGKKYLPAKGSGVIDDNGRYLLGEVEILKRTEKQ